MLKKIQLILDHFNPRFRFFRNDILDGQKVYDVGCGEGNNAVVIKKNHPTTQIDGCDMLPKESVSSLITYAYCDITTQALPGKSAAYDRVIFGHVIEHLDHPEHVMSEIARILKPGGLLYLETPSRRSLWAPSLSLFKDQGGPTNFYDDPTHRRAYKRQELRRYLESAGFRVEKIGFVRSVWRLPLDPIIFLFGLLVRNRHIMVNAFWNTYGWSTYVIARKI